MFGMLSETAFKIIIFLASSGFLSFERVITKARRNAARCENGNSIEKGCSCWFLRDSDLMTGVKCHGDVLHLSEFVQSPSKVSYLDLSDNGIKHLSSEALSNFTNLQSLNLSKNPQIQFTMLSPESFPKLTTLDMTGNSHWLNVSQMESLRMLRVVRGTPLDDLCLRCFLVRNGISNISHFLAKEISSTYPHPVKVYRGCYGNQLFFKDKGFVPLLWLSFRIRCKPLDDRCFVGYAKFRNQSFFRGYSRVVPLNQCWKTINDISIVFFVLAPFAISLNLTVVMVTARSRTVRQNVALLLVSVVAFGDFLMGIYLLVITITRRSVSYQEMTINLQHSNFCYFVGIVSVFGQGVSVFSSFIVTIERYLAVVFCLNPDIRLFPPIAHGCIGITFVLAFLSAILPFTAFLGPYIPDSHCFPISEPTSGAVEYMMIPGGVAFVLYILTLSLYIHMYMYVRKSSQLMGVQREGKVARKIALIVTSNMAFFFLPILLLLLVNNTGLGDILSERQKGIFWKTFNYICFALNACLNPVLFAFRNEKFRLALKQQLCLRTGDRVAPLVGSAASSSKVSNNLRSANSTQGPSQ